VVAQFDFSEAQRRHVTGLIDEWERGLGAAPTDDLDSPSTS
jgi:hypothetical protein